MRETLHPLWLLFGLFTLTMVGVRILALLSPFPADRLTPAQENLLIIGDWMVKVSVGAIIGLGGSRLTVSGKRGKKARSRPNDLGGTP